MEGRRALFTAYVVLTLVTAATTLTGASMNFVLHPIPVAASKRVQAPESLVRPIGAVFLAATVGLLAGFAFRPLGVAASAGLVVHFVLATLAHLRVGDFHLGRPVGALGLVTATLVVTVTA